ncbi:MAG: carbohydrate binding domain-containing protein, partial [Planctomycetota bacterium]|nr:carbohydrate binding domain-containing protein [Planctomycetota bacterium]
FGAINGGTYAQATQPGAAKKNMPDRQQALDYYIAQGTPIPYSVLPKWTKTELIQNTSFETNTANWYPMTSCVLQQSSTQSRNGSRSLLVASRSTSADVAAQDIPVQQIKSGHTYELSVHVSHTSVGTAKGILILESTGEGVQTFTTPPFSSGSADSGQYPWIDLNGNITPTWTGTLTRARIAIWISTNNSYYMDKVSLIDDTYPVNDYVMDRQLISPTVNPYGATNAKGIYVINCAGKDVVIGNSRIVGTLVFIDPGKNSAIQGSVCWEAAVYNFPALLTNKEFSIRTATTGLSEVNSGKNLNPTGTPYPFDGGTANQTSSDSYPSKITGIIYSADKLNLSGSPNIKGVVIADNDVRVAATSVALNYGNIYLNDPPPGFNGGTITMKVVAGTWRRTVD